MNLHLFAAVLALFLSDPAAAAPLRIEAESARIKSTGVQRGLVVNMFQNGEIGDVVDVSETVSGEIEIEVRAFGSPAVGEWPEMGVAIDNEIISSVVVTSALSTYQFRAKVDVGLHKVTVLFKNDLRLERIVLFGPKNSCPEQYLI